MNLIPREKQREGDHKVWKGGLDPILNKLERIPDTDGSINESTSNKTQREFLCSGGYRLAPREAIETLATRALSDDWEI